MLGSKLTIAGFVILAAATTGQCAIRHASDSGSGDCSSWANACGLAQALSGASAGDQVWVKAGTYSGTIFVVNGVKLIGGFAGTETAASQSNPATNTTVIDGGESTRALWVENCAGSTVIRGFTIQNGKDSSWDGGGGLLVQDSGALFVNCIFKSNRASRFGSAVSIRGTSSPHFVNCKFHNNGTGSGIDVQPLGGGAVVVHGGTPTFTNCLFFDNKAGEGGAIAVISGTPSLNNCTIANNQATIGSGGGIFDETGVAVIRNSIIWDNSAVRDGNQIFSPDATTIVSYCNVEGGWSGTGNINSDPAFINPGSGNYDIPNTSPCKDGGNNSDIPQDVGDLDWDNNVTEAVPKDLKLANRKIDFTVDMGAFEAPTSILMD